MPIYEYRCRACRRRVQVITLRASERVEAKCEACGSAALDRLPSRFAMPRSESERLEAMGDPSRLGGLDEDDPRSVARWVRRMSEEAGEDVSREEVDQIADEIESSADGGVSSDED